MNEIRLRRHTDGRVALSVSGDWLIANRGGIWWPRDDSSCYGEGWSEPLVAELPEPDGHTDDAAPYWTSGHDTLPSWVAYADGVEVETGAVIAADELRSDALKMLAAVTACEKYRAQREVTT